MSDNQDIIRWFGRHLVALAGTYVTPSPSDRDRYVNEGVPPDADRTFYAYSGVPVAIDSQWYVLTAGHAIIPHVTALKNRDVICTGGAICDCFGIENPSSRSFPFSLVDAVEFMIDDPDRGLDYAMIRLRTNDAQLMLSNGIIPYDPTHPCHNLPVAEMKECLIVGFPAEVSKLTDCEPGVENQVFLTPCSVPINRMADDDSEYPRLVGEIHHMGDLESIVGLSGGPIFGLFERDSRTRHTLVGIQSRWIKQTRKVFGTTISAILEHFSGTGAS